MSLVLDSIKISLADGQLFKPLSLTVSPGSIVTIMGPSGCGKSTLLALICGMLDPGFSFSGTITLNGRPLNGIDMEHRRVGILFQDDLLFPHLDVFGNMAFGLPARMSRRQKRERVNDSLAAAGLEDFGTRDIATLSGGQKARVSLLRALLAEPEAILLDEPFSKLDEDLRGSIKEFVFEQIVKMNIPALLVTHDRNDSADGTYIELN
ncbi:MAG: ATP-binding cassette domain-containing protein [Desulfocapsaceae bacterium]